MSGNSPSPLKATGNGSATALGVAAAGAVDVMIVGNASLRGGIVASVQSMGFSAVEFDDPYAAMADLARRPSSLRAVILSLQSLYREELQVIPAMKRIAPEVEIWLADIDGRSAALAQAMRMGADGLLGEEGLHRLSEQPSPAPQNPPTTTTANGHKANDTRVAPAIHAAPKAERPPIERIPGSASRSAPVAEPAAAAVAPAAAPNLASERSERSRERKAPSPVDQDDGYSNSAGEPVLSAEELRALLQDPGTPD